MASPKKPATKSGSKRTLPPRAVVSKIDIEGSTPKAIAKSLLSLLPSEATKQHTDAKKLLKSFPLVMAELEKRANAMARKNETLRAIQCRMSLDSARAMRSQR
jgi:hypothetical protein